MERKPSRKSIFSPRYDLFLKLLRETRLAAGLSQHEVAKKLDRPQSYIWKGERNERRIDVIELVDLLIAYDINPADFMKTLQQRLLEQEAH